MYNKENYFGHGALLLCGLSFKKGVFTLKLNDFRGVC